MGVLASTWAQDETDVLDPLYDTLGADEFARAFRDAVRFSAVAELGQQNLVRILRRESPFTLLVPPNTVFEREQATLAPLLKDETDATSRARVREILSRHILRGRYTRTDLEAMPEGKVLITLSNERLVVTKDEGGVRLGGAPLRGEPTLARNGLFYTIDRLFLMALTNA
jgi:uncharacterized surface protein with fasciclin (FAS1) repeats